MPNPLLLLHGYGSSGDAFSVWKDALLQAGRKIEEISIGNYVTLNNEVTVDDIANGLQCALHARGLDQAPFDAIVHSTGMLVIRAWLTASNAQTSRQGLLKHLVALAPATFGSPLAAKGRSLLGRIFQGNKHFGPDFLNSGNLVLSNLELASEYTWTLAHKDLIDKKLYGPGNDTPYVFVFDGTDDYGKLAEIFLPGDQKGSDGVVRWSAVALNTRKITLNLGFPVPKVNWADWSNLLDIPLIPVAGVNHNQILSEPPLGLIPLVLSALNVNSGADVSTFYTAVAQAEVVQQGKQKLDTDQWQQFVVHAIDSLGDPITDYSIEILTVDADGTETSLSNFEADVHPFAADTSYRCFHVQLNALPVLVGKRLIARISASTGTDLVGYQGFGTDAAEGASPEFGPVDLDISAFNGSQPGRPVLFYPFTTTLLEIILNREPIPPVNIFQWMGNPADSPPANNNGN
jgi:pimeloyl-ACP methyl ester carboxylesterase